MDLVIHDPKLLCLGLFLVVMGLDGLLRPTVVKFNRLQNACVRTTHHLWQKISRELKLCALSDIKQATLNENKAYSGAATCVVTLLLKNGETVPLFNHSSAFKKCKKDVEIINQFLESDKNELLIPAYPYWIYIGCLLVSVFFIFKAFNLFELIIA